MNIDSATKFMKLALEQAELSLASGEIPVGCVFVDVNQNIIAVGHNRTNETRNGTRHAEMNAVDDALLQKKLPASVFEKSILYVTCEPCIMCAAAIAKLKISKVCFGCSNDRFGGNGSILNVHNDDLIAGHKYEINTGMLKDEAIEIFQRFYESENRRAPESKRRKKNKSTDDLLTSS